MLHFDMKRPIIPDEYQEMYDNIISPSLMPRDKWFNMPKDSKRRSFLDWYYRVSLCVEFSNCGKFFKVTGIPTWVTLGELYGKGSPYGDFYTKSLSPESIQKQREFWNKNDIDEI